jgi:hypothetical protein
MLNDYTSESRKPYRFPACWVRPLSTILEDDSLERVILGPRLLELVSLGEHELRAQRNRNAKEDLLQRLLSTNEREGQ